MWLTTHKKKRTVDYLQTCVWKDKKWSCDKMYCDFQQTWSCDKLYSWLSTDMKFYHLHQDWKQTGRRSDTEGRYYRSSWPRPGCGRWWHIPTGHATTGMYSHTGRGSWTVQSSGSPHSVISMQSMNYFICVEKTLYCLYFQWSKLDRMHD